MVVQKEQAAGAVAVDDAKQRELRSRAEAFAAELAALDTRSPAFSDKVSAITSMGEREIRASASVSSRMLERPAAAVRSGRGGVDRTRRPASRTPWPTSGPRSPNWTRPGPT